MVMKAKEKEAQWNNFKKLKSDIKPRHRDETKKAAFFSKTVSKVVALNRMKSLVKNPSSEFIPPFGVGL